MSREVFKVSGKKVEWPQQKGAAEAPPWTLTARPGGWVLAERVVAGRLERRRFAMHELRGKFAASLDGFHWHGDLSAVARGGSAAAGGSDADLTAQFPGKVRKLVVQEGAAVEEGAPLVLVEAMKMEFAIKAPYAGTVRKLCVTEGQQLSPGDRLVEMDPAPNGGGR